MTQTFTVVVQFSDANGVHEAGTTVVLPAETETDLQEIATLTNYGIITPVVSD